MKYEIAMAPRKHPDFLILQANRDTWTRLIVDLKANGQQNKVRFIQSQLHADAEIIRITFPTDVARSILQFAGLSS